MSSYFMSSVTRLGLSGCLLAMAMGSASALEQKLAEFDYLRLQASFSAVEGPEVEEESKPSGGSVTHYDWNGLRESGYQAAVAAIFGHGISGSKSYQWGVEAVFGSYDITPKDFTVSGSGGGIVKNGSAADLYYRTYGVNLMAGWQYGMTNIEEWTGFVEIMPHVGLGFATADNEVYTGTEYIKETGHGFYYELGLRVGAYITEKQFIYGVNVNVQYGASKIDVDFDGYDSELEFQRLGFGIGAVAGYRF